MHIPNLLSMSAIAYVIYFFLFLALLLEPHIFKGHVAGLDAPFVQSFSTVVIIVVAAITYWLHQRDIKTLEKEKGQLKQQNATALDHLTDLSAELGLVNRRLPLLHSITTDLLKKEYTSTKSKRAVVERLLATAVVSLSQTEWGMFRFVDVQRGRTVGEFKFARTVRGLPSSIIGNKVLMEWHQKPDALPEQEHHYFFTTTDKTAPVKCHYIIPKENDATKNNEYIIQNVVDQAQLLYRYLYTDQS